MHARAGHYSTLRSFIVIDRFHLQASRVHTNFSWYGLAFSVDSHRVGEIWRPAFSTIPIRIDSIGIVRPGIIIKLVLFHKLAINNILVILRSIYLRLLSDPWAINLILSTSPSKKFALKRQKPTTTTSTMIGLEWLRPGIHKRKPSL
jgi:hypothetical protein